MQPEMKYIYEIYKTGSFSKAASNLYLSQPALSISIKKVEKEIGMPLFDRSQQPLILTDAGKIYIRKIIDMKLLEDDLANELQALTSLDSGKLRIGGTQYFNSYIIPIVIKEYIRRYPKIDVFLLEDNSGLLDDKLSDGTVDIMFHCGKFDTNSLSGICVFQDELFLAVPNEITLPNEISRNGLSTAQIRENIFLKNNCPYISLSSFSDLPFLILTESNNLRERALSICSTAGFTPYVRFYVEQLETAYHLAGEGLGITFVTDQMIKKNPKENLTYYKLQSPEAIRHFQAVTRKKGYMSHIMRKFIELTKSIWLK